MKYLLILLIALSPIFNMAQENEFEKPNLSQISKNIKEKGNLNYDTLMKRYRNGDSILTLEEKRHLYYGYAFHENYSPYGRSKFSDSLRAILKKDDLKETEFKELVRLSDSVLVTRPFDTDALNYQLFAYEQLEDPEKFNKKLVQYRTIFDALFSSGDATSKETAIHVLYTSHEYDILRILRLEFTSQSLDGNYDRMSVKENDSGYDNFYFEISPLLNSMSKMLGKDD